MTFIAAILTALALAIGGVVLVVFAALFGGAILLWALDLWSALMDKLRVR